MENRSSRASEMQGPIQALEEGARSLAARLDSGAATAEEIGQLRSALIELQGVRQMLTASASVAAPLAAGMSHEGPLHDAESAPSLMPAHIEEEGRAHPAQSAMTFSQAWLPENFGRSVGASAGGAASYSQAAGSSSAESLLERIARAVEGMANGRRGRGAHGPRPSEVTGQVAGMLATKPLGEDRLYDSAN